jgi:mono/diheme cytochrome c family protein
MMSSRTLLTLTLLGLALAAPLAAGTFAATEGPASTASASASSASALAREAASELFEREVRPILVAECQSCHGAALQQGGLRLDGRDLAIRGGQRGPAVVPGDPGASLLLQAMRHEELQMPPGKRLPAAQIAAVERWIQAGAPWPAGVEAAEPDSTPHWADLPVERSALPRVRNGRWVRNPIDAFVLSRLERERLTPSPEADRRTLIRRLYYDLVGLPPSPEEVEAFVQDRSPTAYETRVDRLLASPQYGERWARHWLDVARYADSKDGVLMYGDARIRPYAYTYRDYVVRALNEDTPYDRFIREQLAADQAAPPDEPWRLAAMGFVTLGRQFDNNIHDIIDDRIDTVSRGLLGLTVSCARCHDHKYDPIPTADYYSMYGVFSGSEEPLELPLIETPQDSEAYAAFEKEYTAKRQQLIDLLDKQFAEQSEAARKRAPEYLVHAATTEPDPMETAIFFLSLAPEDLRPQIVARWRRLLERRAVPDDPVFGPWPELMKAASAGGADACSAVVDAWRTRPAGTGTGQLNPLVQQALVGAQLSDAASVARVYAGLLAHVYEVSRQEGASLTPEQRQLLNLVEGVESPGYFLKSHTYYYMSRGEKDQYGGFKNELDIIAVRHADAVPARAMVLRDAEEIHEPRIFVRGNASEPGDRVPRRFLRLLAGDDRRPFSNGSGRLDLAHAIADPTNPLTGRVLVNRLWMHHFGEPLVDTPSDFGRRSTPPTHPELLDFLASVFVEPRDAEWTQGRRGEWVAVRPGQRRRGAQMQWRGAGWSLKEMHRLIVTSATYRQASADRADYRSRDPENRLLWRAHRRRLDFEQMRDSLLAVSGRLDLTAGGRPHPNAADPENRRRTLYALVDRQSLPEVFRAFDFPQPDQSVERRPDTTVPQQALFGLNSAFIVAQAKALAARPEVAGAAPGDARIAVMYRVVLARPPTPEEIIDGKAFVRAAALSGGAPETLTSWEQYAQVLLMTNEFMFLD